MPRTPDPVIEDLELPDTGADPIAVGAISNNAGDLKARDNVGVFNLRQSYDTNVHRAEDQLVHEIAETSFTEFTYFGSQVTDVIVWTTAGKTQKIREENYTYTGNKVDTVVTKQYDAGGTLVETYTETYSYSGNKVADITGVLT